MSKDRAKHADLPKVAIDVELHEVLAEAARDLGITGPGVMIRKLLAGLKTAQDVKDLYISQRV